MRDRLGIYIHIPFCVSKCSYCDFYSIAGGKQRMPDYQSALLSHISESAEAIESYEIDSIYIGGGTPSCYGAKRIVEILDELKRIGNVRLDSEITVEVNPDTTKLEELKLLRAEGVNRLSIGVQSANNDILKIIGRRDNFRAVFRAWRDFIRWHGALARKRREIRANRKGSAAENIYRGSVVLRYLFGRRTFGGMMR